MILWLRDLKIDWRTNIRNVEKGFETPFSAHALSKYLSTTNSLRYYTRVLTSFSDNDFAYFNRGVLKADFLGRHAEALEDFKLSLEINPSRHETHYYSAKSYDALSKKDLALQSLKQMLALEPDSIKGHFLMGSLLESSARYQEANVHLKKVVELDPEWIGALELYARTLYMAGDDQASKAMFGKLAEKCHMVEKLKVANGTCYLGPMWVKWVGHIALYLDHIVKLKELGHLSAEKIVILAEHKEIANHALLNCYKNLIEVIEDPQQIKEIRDTGVWVHDSIYTALYKNEPMSIFEASSRQREEWGERPPLLKTSSELQACGEQALRQMGIPQNAWIVGLHVREGGFWSESRSAHAPRDSDIQTYQDAIDEIIRRGGWVIRFGDSTMRPFREKPGFIDYAHSSFKSDWMDTFLCSRSKIFIGTNSGMTMAALAFGIPTILTNYVPIGKICYISNGLLLPKLIFDRENKRLLSLNEMLDPAISRIETGEFYENQKWSLKDNTPEDIRLAVIDLLESIDSSKKNDEIPIQKRSRDLMTKYGLPLSPPIPKSFLLTYVETMN